MGKKKSNYYIDKKELDIELKKYHNENIISEELGEMVLKIVERYASKPNFRNYTYIDDMKSAAVLRIISQLDKIKPEKNAFSYITTTIYNEFLAFLRIEDRNSDVRIRYRNKIWSELSLEEDLEDLNNKNAFD